MAEVFLEGQGFATHLFIKAFTHMEALLTYLNTGVVEGITEPSLLCQLRQLGNSRINPEPVSAPTL